MNRFRLFSAAIALAIVLSGLASAEVPSLGSSAPQFTLPAQDGKAIKLSDYKGKWVVLYFYPKDFTTGCTIEAHNFQRDQAQYQKMGVVILGVSVDDVNSHQSFCTKEGLDFKLLSDSDHKVSEQYGSVMTMGNNTLAARNTFIIGPDGKIAKEFIKVSPQAHSEEVLAALSELHAK